MCMCDPKIREPFCGRPGCEWPKPDRVQEKQKQNIRPWYTKDEILKMQTVIDCDLQDLAQWITDQLNEAFNKGKQIGKGERKYNGQQ